jgi:membrane protease YdiL (CAAX protease family)
MATSGDVGCEPTRGPSLTEAVAVVLAWVFLDQAAGRIWPVPPGRLEAAGYWTIALVRLLQTGFLLLYWQVRRRDWVDFYGFTGLPAERGLKVGVRWALALGVIVGIAEILGWYFMGDSLLRIVAGRPTPRRDLAALLVVGGFIGPAFEELLFRGVLYRGLRDRFGVVPSVLAASLIFASAHQAFHGLQPVQAAGGILFCVAYEVSGSLWAPLVLHITGNLAIFLAPFLCW